MTQPQQSSMLGRYLNIARQATLCQHWGPDGTAQAPQALPHGQHDYWMHTTPALLAAHIWKHC